MEGRFTLCGIFEMMSELLQVRNLDLSLLLIQGIKTLLLKFNCVEERLLDIEIPSKRYNNLTKDERDALYSLKDDPSIIIKGADKGSVVVVWDREDYLKEAYKQLYDREVYEEVPNDPNVLINTIMKALEKIVCVVTCLVTPSIIFLLKIPNLLDSMFYQKFINANMTCRFDQLFPTGAFTLRIHLHFWTNICNHLLSGLNLILRTLIIF